MRRPTHKHLPYGTRRATWAGGWCWVWFLDRWRGWRLSHFGPYPGAHCDWMYRLLGDKESKVKKPTAADTPDGSRPPHAPGGAGWTKCPAVLEWFTQSKYEDGSPRKGGWFSLYAENGVWRVMMKEPSAGLIMRVEVKSLDLLWATLEVVLSEKTVPWQKDDRSDLESKKRGKKGS